MAAIQFLTRVGQTCTPIRQEFILLSDVLGVSALVDSLNNPPVAGATESSVLGPFFTEDAQEGQSTVEKSYLKCERWNWLHRLTSFCGWLVAQGESIASEGKGDYLWVEGRVLNTKGEPIPDTLIETWETDA